jgi:hypothetical protein
MTIILFASMYIQGQVIEVFGGYSMQRVDTEQFSEFNRYAGLTPSQMQTNFGATAAQLDAAFKDTYGAARDLRGVNASFTYYFIGGGGLGVTGDFAYHTRKQDRNTPNNPIFFEDFTRTQRRVLTLTAGPQFKFNQNGAFQPFVHALFGITRQKNRSSQFFNSVGNTNPGGTNQPIETTRLVDNFTAFTAGAGGGLDVGVAKHLLLRVVQVDYLGTLTRSRDASLTAPTIAGAPGPSLGQTSFDGTRRDNWRLSFGVVFRN